MEIQLQELIQQIKKDGVEAAENQAANILSAANAEAQKIISDAKAEAKKLISDAKEENARLVCVSEDAIRQAGRNLLISFRDSVNKELNAIIGDEVKAVYSSEAFAGIIAEAAAQLSQDNGDMSVILNSKDIEKVEKSLLAALKEKAVNGVTLKPNDDFNGGFRILVNGGRAYYDYASKEVTDMLSAYLNPRVTALMKEAE